MTLDLKDKRSKDQTLFKIEKSILEKSEKGLKSTKKKSEDKKTEKRSQSSKLSKKAL